MSFTPTPIQTLLLFRLLFGGDEPKKSDLKPQLPGPAFKQLLDAGFVELEKRGRASHVLLTDRAWAWCREHLDAPFSPTLNAARVLQSLLPRLKGYLDVQGASLADLMAAAAPPPADASTPDVRTRIRETCLALGGGRTDTRVRLKNLRAALSDVPRERLDAALFALQREGGLALYHLDDPRQRDAEDEAAAIEVLNSRFHIVYLTE